MAVRPDLLAGLSARQRLIREHDDATYLARSIRIEANEEAMAVAGQTFAGVKNAAISASDLKPYKPGSPVDAIVCARLDLDHPLYFADNLLADCADCACNLQYRPQSPPGTHLCVCCCARRVREERGE